MDVILQINHHYSWSFDWHLLYTYRPFRNWNIPCSLNLIFYSSWVTSQFRLQLTRSRTAVYKVFHWMRLIKPGLEMERAVERSRIRSRRSRKRSKLKSEFRDRRRMRTLDHSSRAQPSLTLLRRRVGSYATPFSLSAFIFPFPSLSHRLPLPSSSSSSLSTSSSKPSARHTTRLTTYDRFQWIKPGEVNWKSFYWLTFRNSKMPVSFDL